MRGILALGLVWCLFAPAPSRAQSEWRTFSSPEGFAFKYPDSFVQCVRDPHQPTNWEPDSCDAATPVCSDVTCSSDHTLACVAYSLGQNTAGTNLEAAAFSVNQPEDSNTENKCLNVPEPPPHVGVPRAETINGVKFKVTEIDGVGTGHVLDGYVYRTFHRGRCYELGLRIAFNNLPTDDITGSRQFDLEQVRRDLKKVASSFKFR